MVRDNLKTLWHIHAKRAFHAENGQPGQKRKRHGRDGKAIVIPVPPGTVLKDAETGSLLKDLTTETEWLFLRGGIGGRGNARFATSTRQAPRFAQPGRPGQSVRIKVELNLIADIGLVGMPNAGKSTLLSVLSNARPQIGAYPFTTRIPNLGVMFGGDQEVIIADIPGLIEGASTGAGLGDRFLKHIARTKALAILIDLTDEDRPGTFQTLMAELGAFDSDLLQRERTVVGTKLDLVVDMDQFDRLRSEMSGETVHAISAVAHTGLRELRARFLDLASGRDRRI